MRPLFFMLMVLTITTTTVTADVNYDYDPIYTVTSDVATCEAGTDAANALSVFGCPVECRGVAVDGKCVCVACDTTLTKDSVKSLDSTNVVADTSIVFQTPGFTMDIGDDVFVGIDGTIQVDVYDQQVQFGVLTTRTQVSDVFVFRPLAEILNHFVGVTLNYSADSVYPGWNPFIYTMNMTNGLWYDIGASLSYGDGTIYFETDTFIGQYVVVASSKSGSLLSPRSFYGRVCECDPDQDLEISMPCSAESDVICSPPRLYNEFPKKQFSVIVTLPDQDPRTLDEYLYRAALAQVAKVDFRDIAVSSVVES
jgi:hypothetical protein